MLSTRWGVLPEEAVRGRACGRQIRPRSVGPHRPARRGCLRAFAISDEVMARAADGFRRPGDRTGFLHSAQGPPRSVIAESASLVTVLSPPPITVWSRSPGSSRARTVLVHFCCRWRRAWPRSAVGADDGLPGKSRPAGYRRAQARAILEAMGIEHVFDSRSLGFYTNVYGRRTGGPRR